MMGRLSSNRTNDPIARIREEGLEHSKVMETISYLTDVIGPRLTGSPNLKRANEWTRGKLEDWGLTNAQLEAWGPFGRGWSLKRFSAQIVEPQAIPSSAFPRRGRPDWTSRSLRMWFISTRKEMPILENTKTSCTGRLS